MPNAKTIVQKSRLTRHVIELVYGPVPFGYALAETGTSFA